MTRSTLGAFHTATIAIVFLVIVGLSLACGRLDSEVAAAIKKVVANDPVTAPLELSVEVRRGVAYLSGEATTCAEQQRAGELAKAIEGVSSVVNNVQLRDPLLADEVRKALAADALVAKVPIEVDARNGHVRLMSDATDRQHRERAVSLARNVCGVREVEDRMK